jgi:hypothetical protein
MSNKYGKVQGYKEEQEGLHIAVRVDKKEKARAECGQLSPPTRGSLAAWYIPRSSLLEKQAGTLQRTAISVPFTRELS